MNEGFHLLGCDAHVLYRWSSMMLEHISMCLSDCMASNHHHEDPRSCNV